MCWLKWLPETSAVARDRRARAVQDAIPEEQRVVGADAIPLREMDTWLGWD